MIEFPPHNEEISNRIGGYWDSTKTRDIFAPSSPEGEKNIILSMLADDLLGCINNHRIEEFIEKDEKESELNSAETISINTKCIYLYNAYVMALENMPTTRTWEQCCRDAIEKLHGVGITTITSEQTLTLWHRQFR